MNDLKNILNYFGDFWELRSLGEVYIFTAYRGKGCFTKILADTLEDLSEKIHQLINECAIKKPNKVVKLKGLTSIVEKPDKHFDKSIQGITKSKYQPFNSSETKLKKPAKKKGKK